MTPDTDALVALLPCPFCNADGPVMMPCFPMGPESSEPRIIGIDSFYVHCDGCGADGPPENNEGSARDLWNRRPALTAAQQKPQDDGWVKCSERLPEDCEIPMPYLVMREKSTVPEIGYYCTNWESPYPWSLRGTLRVTHWRPLPPLPKD